MRKLFFLCLLASLPSYGQVFVLSNNPPAVQWQQINSPSIKVIYQPGAEVQAQRIANTLEHIRAVESRALTKAPRKLSIILQGQSAISNGFVSLTPRRSEFYVMPPQDYNFLGSNDWLTLLAVHEYRHVVQFQQAITGFNKLFYYAFGPATTAAMANVAVPDWFWEGDAVATETALTHSGRGRITNFNLMFRVNLLEGRSFNYEKQMLQSYKHFIPNHYVFGYNMVSYLREKTNDPEVWGKITNRTWSVPFLPFRFSSSIRKYSGLRVKQLYGAMATEYTHRWRQEIDTLQLTPYERVNNRISRAYTNYSYPQVLQDGSVVVMKSGIGDIDQLVVVRNGKERSVFTQGIVNDPGMLSATNSKVVWTEYEFDPRWRVKNYSVIKAYDVASKQLWRLSSKSRLAGAALSPDGYKVVAVETDEQYQTQLNVYDFFTKKTLYEFHSQENNFLSMPRFSADGKKIVALKTTLKGKTVTLFDLGNAAMADVFPVTSENIGHPVLVGDLLFFNSPVSGIDNIYAYNIATKIRYQVTNSKYGAFNPAFSNDGKIMFYNEQTRDGSDVVKAEVNPGTWKPVNFERPAKTFFEFLSAQEGRPNLLDSVPQQQYTSKKYSKFSGIINPVSWGAYFDNNITSTTIGVTSRNLLSTTAVSAGYDYNMAENSGAWNATVSYQGWYPIVDVSATMVKRSVNDELPITEIFNNKDVSQIDTVITNALANLSWTEKRVTAGLRLPLVTTKSKYISGLTISNYISVTKVDDFQNSAFPNERFVPGRIIRDIENGDTTTRAGFYIFREYVGNNRLVNNQFRFNTYRFLKQSTRDFLPKWGQVLNLEWYKTGFGSSLTGSLFAFYTQLYFPGLFKHHSFNGYWAYQKGPINFDRERNYLFANRIPVPRGVAVFRYEEFYSMSANYAFPLWYPDVHLGPLVNIQRVRVNGFFDYGFGSTPAFESSGTFASTGVEVKLDLNFLRFAPQFDVGFRYTVGISGSVTPFEFLLGTINF
jgi:hypothetical protein